MLGFVQIDFAQEIYSIYLYSKFYFIEGLDFDEMQGKTMRLILKTNIASDKWKILKMSRRTMFKITV